MAQLLIVDDEDQLRATVRRVLERRGHVVWEAHDVAEARSRLAVQDFELMLCDIRMAGESGLTLAREVVSELADTAVVMVSGVDDPVVAEEALAMGVYGYLLKPFLPNEIVITVASALRRRDMERDHRRSLEEMESKVLSRGSALRDALQALGDSEAGAKVAEQGVVDRLIAALALRGVESPGHIERMGRYAAALAARGELGEWTNEEFRVAAMLHDVGQIAIPDVILLKPGPLSDRDRAALQRHPGLGARMLGPGGSRVIQLGATIALSHHEWWDGGGYPGGLAAEAIPVEGRVVAVVDAFDALTSHNLFRSAVGADEALTIMVKERGGQFDPDLLDLFVASIEEMLTIRAAHPDPSPSADVRVMVVGTRRLFTDALARAMGATEGIVVVATAASGREAENLVAESRAEVIVADAELSDVDGYQLARRVLGSSPTVAIILLAARDDDAVLLSALEAGCAGVVRQDRAFEELGAAIVAAHGGESVVAPGRLMSLLSWRKAQADARLTPRETDVLRLMFEGLSNEIIAERLFVTLNTVRNHVQRVLSKLSAHSKLEAVAEARRRGLIGPP